MRALTPVARVRSRLLPVNVLDDLGKIVVRLRVEEPTAVARRRRQASRCAARLHVVGVLGYDARATSACCALLTGELGLVEAPRPVQDDAVEAAGGSAGGTSSKLRVDAATRRCAPTSPPSTVLRRLLEIIEANLPGTLADVDSEFLHDLRVAVRRTRALQRELRGVFAPEPLRVFRDGFKRAAGGHRARRATSTSSCSSSTTSPRRCPPTIARRRRAAARAARGRLVAERAQMVRALRSDAHARAAGQLARLPRRARRRRPRTTAPTPRGRSPTSPASGSPRSTGGW